MKSLKACCWFLPQILGKAAYPTTLIDRIWDKAAAKESRYTSGSTKSLMEFHLTSFMACSVILSI
jgi:hypothetical protein